MPTLDSDHLKYTSYDPAKQIVTIEFHRGGVYQYHGVPLATYEGLLRAPSASSYFQQHIKPRYRTTKIHRK